MLTVGYRVKCQHQNNFGQNVNLAQLAHKNTEVASKHRHVMLRTAFLRGEFFKSLSQTRRLPQRYENDDHRAF